MPAPNRVRELRVQRGLSQAALAERARLTRQSILAIESARSTPGVDVALRLASALTCSVEDLFGATGEAPLLETVGPPARSATRVALARIRDRWVSLPLSPLVPGPCADGLVAAQRREVRAVAPLTPLSECSEHVALMGCATGLGLIADRLNARRGPGRFLWLSAPSQSALDALSAGHTHVAGLHLGDDSGPDHNLAALRETPSPEPLVLVTMARWEAGLVMRPGAACAIRALADLARPGLRLVAREPGAGAQRLLLRRLRAERLPQAIAKKAGLIAQSHAEVARAIALGVADVGIATRDVADAAGLRFVPLASERYDLALPRALLTDPRIARLLDTLTASSTRRELEALGYDTRPSGQVVADLEAA